MVSSTRITAGVVSRVLIPRSRVSFDVLVPGDGVGDPDDIPGGFEFVEQCREPLDGSDEPVCADTAVKIGMTHLAFFMATSTAPLPSCSADL